MKNKIVTFNGHFGENNVGDDLLLLALLIYFLKDANISKINILTGNCKNTMAMLKREQYLTDRINLIYSGRWGLREPNRNLKYSFNWILKLLISFKTSTLHLIGPGNIIKDNTNALFVCFWLSKALFSILFNRKFAFIGIGVAEIRHFHSKIFIKFVMNKASFITTRDRKSISNLKKLHVNKPLIKSYPDLVFSIASLFSKIIKNRKIQEPKKIGINFRQFSRKHFDNKTLLNYQNSIVSFLLLLLKSNNYECVFYSFCNEFHQSDREMYKKIQNECLKSNIQISYFEYDNCSELINNIQTCYAYIGTRFHSVILATQGCIPNIGISYEWKLKNFMEESGMGDYSINVENLTENKLWFLWDKLIRNYDYNYKNLVKLNQNIDQLVTNHFKMCGATQANFVV